MAFIITWVPDCNGIRQILAHNEKVNPEQKCNVHPGENTGDKTNTGNMIESRQ